MTNSTRTVAPVLASTVRTYFRADDKRMARLSPAAQATVVEGALGRLHREAVKEFNAKRPVHRRYVVGATTNHKAVTAEQRATLRAAGLAGERGPLSKAARKFLADNS